ncbi:MAG: glycosyltransferase family 4 protein [Pseudomonadota bacterium]
MTTILHSIDTGGPGGAETVFTTLAGAERAGVRNVALAKPGGWVEQTLTDRNIDAHYANPKGSFNTAYLKVIINLIRDHDVDLVQSHLFGSNLYCAIAARLCRVPLVAAFHGAHDLVGSGMATSIKRALVQRGAHALVAVSHTLRAELVDAGFGDLAKLSVVHNGVDIDRFDSTTASDIRAQLGIPDTATLIGAVGNVRRPKGYEVLVAAIAQLRQTDEHVHLVIAGQGSGALLKELQAHIAEHDLGAHVHLPGFVADTPGFLKAIDVYVSSSHTEGFSLSCVEAMASRTPVVATRCGGPEEILDHDITGLLVPTTDPAALAQAIARTLAKPDLTQARVAEAFSTARELFSTEAMIRGYADIYATLLNQANPR